MTGHESEIRLVLLKAGPCAGRRRGPAGMEAARAAALRRHKVTLVERSGRLGGTLFFAALAYANRGLLDYLTTQMRKLQIDVRLNTVATPELIGQIGATAVIVATGAERNAPPIPGAELDHVWSGDELRRLMTDDRAEEIAKRKLSFTQRTLMKAGSLVGVTDSTDAIQNLSRVWMPLGKKVAIIGGGLVGIELAEFLVDRGREVVVLEEGPSLGRELSIVRRWRVLDTLRQHGVELHTRVRIESIDKKAVKYTDAEGQSHTLPAESVVLAVGARPDDTLARSLEAAGVPVSSVGDGAQIGYIEGAVKSGMLAGLSA